MKEKDAPLTEQESLAIITEMIQKAKNHFHESGTSAILWGSVIGICGIFTFIQFQFNWDTGWFDIWYLAFFAMIPQVFINIKERQRKTVKTHRESAIDAIWTVYVISIFALLFYFNVVPVMSDKLLAAEGAELFIKDRQTGSMEHWKPVTMSAASLMMILYAIPTLATGIASKFKPMILGSIVCYVFFIISCYTSDKYDWLLNGSAAILNWLIPGIFLRKKYLQSRTIEHV